MHGSPRNEEKLSRISGGLVISCIGDGGGPTYKYSRQGKSPIDRAMAHVLRHHWRGATLIDFTPYGYDERQFCSPAFDLPVGLFQRSLYGSFPEYHTSADNLDFIRPEHLAASYRTICAAIDILENDRRVLNTNPHCEPQLGKRGLYASIGGDKASPEKSMALLWVLNFSDGTRSLLDIAERAALPFSIIDAAARLLAEHGLVVPASDAPATTCSLTRRGHALSLSEITETGSGHEIANAGSS